MSGARVLTIARRIVHGFRRDHRSLALLIVVPVVVSALLGWIVTTSTAAPPRVLAAVGDAALAPRVEDALGAVPPDEIAFAGIVDEADGRQALRDGEADVLLVIPAGTLGIVQQGGTPVLTVVTPGIDAVSEGGSIARLRTALVSVFAQAPGAALVPEVTRETIYGSPDADQMDVFGPVFVAFIGYFFVFILTGVSFLRERVGGTLERLLATPVRRAEVIAGYSTGFGLFAGLQVVVLLVFALMDVRTPELGPIPELQVGLGVANAGSPLLVFLVVLLLALGAVNLAILLSTFARTELQVIQFIPLVIVPQALLAGLIWPVETLPPFLEALSRVMPMRYGIEGLRSVMIRGAGLGDPTLQVDLLVLVGVAVAFVVLAGRTVRREVV